MTNSIAKVVVDLALDREFDYRIPTQLADTVHIGSRVRVPFGRTVAQGYVVGLADSSQYATLKEISIPDMMYRDDIGEKLEKEIPTLQAHGYATEFKYE